MWVYLLAGALYIFGVWEHIPYGGGHLYSDIVTVYQNRFCHSGPCGTGLPYTNYFVEYPVIVGFFMYAMGMLGRYLPFAPSQGLLVNYYFWSALLLLIPTYLSIDELFKIADIVGLKSPRRRILLYFVATPSFVFMVLTNWYIIGVFFTLFGLRKFLQGSRWVSGILLGISAAANLVTAMPALGLILAMKDRRETIKFLVGVFATVGIIYFPVIVLNSFPHSYLNAYNVTVNYPFKFPNLNVITDFFQYQANWYTEGSWMLALFSSYNPIRHVLFPAAFILLSGAIVFKGFKMRWMLTKSADTTFEDWANYVVLMAALFSFAWLFSSYVSTPQTNLLLLPFFTLLPMSKYYPEFLVFDTANSLIDVYGFSQPLLVLGITLHPVMFGSPYQSQVQALEVIRSLWIGKFLIYDGLLSKRFSTAKLTIRKPPETRV